MNKELLIMRHAKSSWNNDAPDDFSRPLNQRGVKAAKLMGRTLREMDCLPQCIYLSSALRTRETCELFLQAAQQPNIPQYSDRRLYLAGLQALLNEIHAFDPAYQRVMLIGHNPGLEMLLLHLCPDAPTQADGKLLTTANLAHIRLHSDSWTDYQAAELVTLLRPRELAMG